MEANPIEFKTPLQEEKLLKKLNVKTESNLKKKYSIDISCYSSYMDINIELMDKTQNINYNQKFSIEEIKSISKYFLICESISDVIFSIEPNITQIKLIEENNQINLIIPLNHPLCKEAIFIIPEKIKIYDSKELYYIISELRNNIQEQKNTINKQQDLINNQQNLINNQQNDIKELKKRIEILENKIKETEINDDDFDLKYSNIIQNDIEKEKAIKKWINPFKKIKFELLFRMTKDGYKSKDFHECCDNQGPTITLVQTDKNYKFGGYTPYSWKSKIGSSPENDKDTFLFSLNLMKKFKKIKEGTTIFYSFDYGPCFGKGGTDFYIKNDSSFGVSVEGNFLNNYELTNGEEGEFRVKELEIYKVIFI